MPAVLVFDVNGTLSDLTPMGQRFADVGEPPELVRTWFAEVLRDGIALTAAGGNARFVDIARDVLGTMLVHVRSEMGVAAAVEHVLAGFSELPVHDDVVEGVRALADLRPRLVTMSNGSVPVAEELLGRAGVRDRFAALLSVDDAGAWKPARAAYEYALRSCGASADEAMLVAAHPWDCDGAHRAGLASAWINRDGGSWPGHFHSPDLQAPSLVALATRLAGEPHPGS